MINITMLRSALALGALAGAANAQAWINEFHYDNVGGDVGEFVEIAGPAGTDLTGWTVEAYNGSPTQLNNYDTITLSGTIPDEGCGFGALDFDFPSLQNGAPDGLALIAADGTTVVEFLSYEGSFTPTSGTASGIPSVDVGVSENSSTAVGDSLQRTGIASSGDGFGWATEMPQTRGSINTDQTIAPLALTVSRNGGTNPASYTANPIVLGGTFDATVDLSTTGHSSAFLFAFDSPISVTLGGGQTLLCIDGLGAGELFTGSGLTLSGSPIATISLPVPNNPGLCGRSLCSQALHAFGVNPFALSNALDHTTGSDGAK